MSKREHITQQSNPLLDFLQAHNCIFYSPLTQDDTTDWISGNSMVKYNANSAMWDSANNIWKFQYVSGQPYNANQYYAKWDLKETILQSSINFTSIAQLRAYSVSNVNACYDILPNRGGLSMYGTINQETQSAQVFYTDSVSHQLQYRNAVKVLDYAYGSILNAANGTTGIRIGCPNQSEAAKTYGMRNFSVYSEMLSLSEINEYFSLI